MLVLAKQTTTRREYKRFKIELMDNVVLMDKLKDDNQKYIALFNEEVEKVETFILYKYLDLK
jgi:hypothetical protein